MAHHPPELLNLVEILEYSFSNLLTPHGDHDGDHGDAVD